MILVSVTSKFLEKITSAQRAFNFAAVSSPPGHYRFRPLPMVFNYLYENIKEPVAKECPTIQKGDIIRILNKYLTPRTAADNMRSGHLRKDITIDGWDGLARMVIYEFKSERLYLKELELAEIAERSRKIPETCDRVIPLLDACIDQTVAVASKKLGQWDATGDLANKIFQDHVKRYERNLVDLEFKHYRPFDSTLRNRSLKEWVSKAAQLTQPEKIALIHDQLQVIWDLYCGILKLTIKPFWGNPHPLSRDVRTQTGTYPWTQWRYMEWRNPDVDKRSKDYMKALGRPSEAGPSYTTVRFCGINVLLKAIRKYAGETGTPLLGRFEIATELTADEMSYLVWGIFGYWSLHYRKSLGPAHTYFEIAEAAGECGFPIERKLSLNEDLYPTPESVRQYLTSSFLSDPTSSLRKRALLMGMEQAIIADYDTWSDALKRWFKGGTEQYPGGARKSLPA